MTLKQDLRYGKPTRAQAEAFVGLAGHAFAFDSTQWLGSLGDDGWDNIRTLTNGEEVAAGLVFHSAGQWFGGQRVPSCAISAVLAAPESRRRKLGHSLMLQGLRETRAAGVPLSVLYASTPAFYRGLGFEPAGEQLFRRVASHHLPTDTEGARYVPLTADAQPVLHELYTRFASVRTGLLDRTAHFWRAHLRPYDGSKRYLYGVELDGIIEGYVSLQHARPQSTLVVQDAIASGPRAARAVLALLSHHKSVAEWVVFPDGPQGPLNKAIPGNQARPEPSPQEWMLRVVDVQSALERRGYPPLEAELELDVVDATLPENEGRCVLSLSPGKPARVSSGGAGRLRLDVRALSAVYSGFSHPREMQAAGLLSGEAGDVALLGAVFASPRAFLLDSF